MTTTSCLSSCTYSTSSHSARASNGSGIQRFVLSAFCSSAKKSRIGSRALSTSSIPEIMKLISGQPRTMSVKLLIAAQPDPTFPRAVIVRMRHWVTNYMAGNVIAQII